MNTVDLRFDASDLASRSSARGLRERVEDYLSNGQEVEFDLSRVRSISDSYADELFGVLAWSLGLETFTRSTRFRGGSDQIYRHIAFNIDQRLKEKTAA